MSDYILAYSKTKFYPLEPRIEDIKIEDIAHSLSLMTRANGHFNHFYSVAQHSVNCYKEAKSRGYSERVQLGCLLHDASESYISDITRPVKRNLPEYSVIEEKLQKLIFERFGLGDLCIQEEEQIRMIDDALLYYEFETLMNVCLSEVLPQKTIEHDLSQRDFKAIEKQFLSAFYQLTGQHDDRIFVGIDGCKGGWIAVSLSGSCYELGIFKDIEAICSKYNNFENMIIDMPIGLPESQEDIRPDDIARKMLKGKASSIFNTPCRQAVYSEIYSEANEINKTILGKGLSSQSFAICGKIREIDEFLSKNSHYKNGILESHPELCFALLNGGNPILDNKKNPDGERKRVELLRDYYEKTEDLITFAMSNTKIKHMMDDVLDALCLAVVGKLISERGFMCVPETPMMDNTGLLMQMIYPK